MVELDAENLGVGADRPGVVLAQVQKEGRQRVEPCAPRVGGGDLRAADAVDPVHLKHTDRVAAVTPSRPHVRFVPATEGEADLAAHQTGVEAFLKQEHRPKLTRCHHSAPGVV